VLPGDIAEQDHLIVIRHVARRGRIDVHGRQRSRHGDLHMAAARNQRITHGSSARSVRMPDTVSAGWPDRDTAPGSAELV
jgi:hypothetical protein